MPDRREMETRIIMPVSKADRVPIDALEGFFLIEHTDQDHDAGAHQRDDRAVDFLRHDDGVGDGEDAGGDPHRVKAKIDVRRRVCGHGRELPDRGRPADRGLPHPCICQKSGTRWTVKLGLF